MPSVWIRQYLNWFIEKMCDRIIPLEDLLMSLRIEKHITVQLEGAKAIDVLSNQIELSKQKLKKAMSNGAVWLESDKGVARCRRSSKIIPANSVLHVYYDERIQNEVPEPAKLIADEGEYSVWNKPYGMYSQGSKWGDNCTIQRWVEKNIKPERPVFIAHRLDRATSGLMILAHSKSMVRSLADLFSNRKITKHYEAIVKGDLSSLALPYEMRSRLDDKQARTIILQSIYDNSLGSSKTLLDLKTGRKHQIRRHLAELGYPVIGDRHYGRSDSELDLQLRSVFLEFLSPVDGQLKQYSL